MIRPIVTSPIMLRMPSVDATPADAPDRAGTCWTRSPRTRMNA